MSTEEREREIGMFAFGLRLSKAKKYLVEHQRTRHAWIIQYQNKSTNLVISLDLFYADRFLAYSEPGTYFNAEELFEFVSNKDSDLYDPDIENAFLFNMHILKKLSK